VRAGGVHGAGRIDDARRRTDADDFTGGNDLEHDFNALFERLERKRGWTRTFAVRSVHALLFEAGLILAVVPLAAWWLDISLVRAFCSGYRPGIVFLAVHHALQLGL